MFLPNKVYAFAPLFSFKNTEITFPWEPFELNPIIGFIIFNAR